LRDHVRKITNDHRGRWVQSVIGRGLKPKLIVIEEVTQDNWEERERYWITHYRQLGCDLTNSTDGGDGISNPSREIRARISKSLMGNIVSPETRAKIGAFSRNRKMPEEAKQRIRQTLKGRKHSPERIAAILAGKKPITQETRHKMSVAKKGKPGKPMSEETKQKIRESKLGERNPMFGKHFGRIPKTQLPLF
jgi:hypothetical protein